MTGGWGTADTGGAWTVGNTSYYSTTGGFGVISAAAGSTTFARLTSISSTGTEVLVACGFSALPASSTGNVYAHIHPRSIVDTASSYTSYGVGIALSQAGLLQLIPQINNVAGTAYVVATGVAANALYAVRCQVFGTSPTTIQARAWLVGAPEPTAWQISVTDSTSANQAAGAIALGSYLTSSATNGPINVSFDGLAVSSIAGASPITASVTASEGYVITGTAAPANGGTMTYSINPTTNVKTLGNGVFEAPLPAVGTQVTYTVVATETYSSGSVSATATTTLDGGSATNQNANVNTLVRVNGVWT